jgi:hypothetical protein
MTAYTLTKGNVKIQVRIDEENAEMIRTVGDTIDTSKTALTPKEANRLVADLLRQGYAASKATR